MVFTFNKVKNINCFSYGLEKSMQPPGGHRCSPILSSVSFTTFYFTFMPLIHFRLIFVQGVRPVSRLIFFCMWNSSCSRPFFELTVLLPHIAFPHLSIVSLLNNAGLFLSSLFCSIVVFIYSFTSTILFWLQQLQVGWVQSFQICSSPSYCTAYSESFASPYKLQKNFFNIHKITCLDFNWDFTKSIEQVGKN